ncbi:MAG: DUF4142 domain-containing protein [Pseudonocardia sp.]|nr:DUF4142 domain-containing protein [Pseudonocardia sp.]
MLRRIPRILQLTMLVAVVLAVSATVYQSWTAGSGGTGGMLQTKSGPLSAADRDLVVKVRLAGLWEGPTAQQATVQASATSVRDIAAKIAAEHAELDQRDREVASELAILLPSSPNAQQIGWMNAISSETGADYDRTFVQILREAHGSILPAIAEVRATTRNDTIREFAEFTDGFVTRHHQYLESTGLVNYAALRQAASPGFLAGATGPLDLIVPILVFVAIVLGAVAMIAALRQRGAGKRPERVTVSKPPQRATVGAAIPSFTAVAAIEGPRVSQPEPQVTAPAPRMAETSIYSPAQEIPTYGVSDTGGYRQVSEPRLRTPVPDAGRYSPTSSTGSYQSADQGSYPSASEPGYPRRSDSGSYPQVSEPGYPRRSDSGSYPQVSEPGYPRRSDSGSYPQVSEPGHPRVSDSGSHQRVSDSGRYRTVPEPGAFPSTSDSDSPRVSDTGSHRARSRPRHSVRR